MMHHPNIFTNLSFLSHFLFACVLGFCGLLCLTDTAGNSVAWLSLIILTFNIHSLAKVRNNLYFVIIYFIIFYSNYSICMANYVLHINSFFTSLSVTATSIQGLHLLFFFSFVLDIFTPSFSKQKISSLILQNRNNFIISLFLLICLILIGIFSFNRPAALGESGGYSPLYEYSTIIGILGIYFSGKSRILHILYITILSLLALQNFMFGGRVVGLELLICIMLCFCVEKITWLTTLLSLCVFVPLCFGIGKFRSSFLFNIGSILYIWPSILQTAFTSDTAYSAYFTSLSFIDLANSSTWGQRLYLLKQYILYIFCGSGIPNSNLAIYTHQFTKHYFGGILPFFGYFYLGNIGVIFLGIYLKKLFSIIHENIKGKNHGFKKCLGIYITVTVFRWYLYSPAPLCRGILFLWVLYFLLTHADIILKKVSNQKN